MRYSFKLARCIILKLDVKYGMESETQKLVQILNKIICILDEDGQYNWSKRMIQARGYLLVSTIRGVEKVLSAYGGMGSFNDVYLSKITRKNKKFSELQSLAWQLATDIKQEYEANI